jgi:Flp pilus assembly protein TadB
MGDNIAGIIFQEYAKSPVLFNIVFLIYCLLIVVLWYVLHLHRLLKELMQETPERLAIIARDRGGRD